MDFSINEDFFLNLKLPSHLPNEVPKSEVPPLSLPPKPPLSLPPIPRHSLIPKSQKPQKQKKEQNKLVPKLTVKNEDLKAIDNSDLEPVEEVLEELNYKKNKDPIPIPGTSIILSTDEDIAKWIEERKKNWPSKKRIEEKAKNASNNKRPHTDDADNDADVMSRMGTKRQKRYCKFFIRGNCRNDKCGNLHEIPLKPLHNNKIVHHHGISIQMPERYSKPINSGGSLHNLVMEHDYYKFENVKVLQVIDKLFSRQYLKSNYDMYKK